MDLERRNESTALHGKRNRAASGIELDQRIASVHRLSQGMIVSVGDFPNREALEAAGRSE